MSDHKETRRTFIKGSMAKGLIATNAGVLAGLINTPGIVHAEEDTTEGDQGTTQPNSTAYGVELIWWEEYMFVHPTNPSFSVSGSQHFSSKENADAYFQNYIYDDIINSGAAILVNSSGLKWFNNPVPNSTVVDSSPPPKQNFCTWTPDNAADPSGAGTLAWNFPSSSSFKIYIWREG